jgi:hypothetical protein
LRGCLNLFFRFAVSNAVTASAEARGGLCDPLASLSPSSAIMPSSSVAITGSESSSKNEDGVGEGGGVSSQPEVGVRVGVSGSI